jgi:hypothetical protein
LEQGIRSGADTLTIDDLEKVALPNKALRTIIDEALRGELKLKDEKTEDIRALLHTGLPIICGDLPGPAKRSTKGRRVGERAPVRDPVGGLRDARH